MRTDTQAQGTGTGRTYRNELLSVARGLITGPGAGAACGVRGPRRGRLSRDVMCVVKLG